jgi:MoxR-like ATPase
LQQIVRGVPVTDHVIRYALSLVRQTRVNQAGIPDFVRDQISWGAGPRAVQFLILGGKARALLHGRDHVSTDDIQALAKPVLRHRLVVNFAAEAEGVTSDDVIQHLVWTTPTKEDELTTRCPIPKDFCILRRSSIASAAWNFAGAARRRGISLGDAPQSVLWAIGRVSAAP